MSGNDWDCFREGTSLAEVYEPVKSLGSVNLPLSAAFQAQFPKLTKLLLAARRTKFDTAEGPRQICAWTTVEGDSCGWLCFPPTNKRTTLDIHPHHRLLLSCFGGIDEYWNDPNCLLNNLHGALGISHAEAGFGYGEELFRQVTSWLDDERDEQQIDKIEPKDHIVFAQEGNGDFFAYNRRSGDVILVGFDTGRSDLRMVPGYLDLVYTVNHASHFTAWVELLARQYLEHLNL